MPERPLVSRRGLIATATTAFSAGIFAWSDATEASARGILLEDRTEREYRSVLLLADSTSSRTWRRMSATMAAHGLGPFRIDLQPGRSLSNPGGWGRTGVEAVRHARADGFRPAAIVVALGFPDIVHWRTSLRTVRTADEILHTIRPLLEEIGPATPVGFLNLYASSRVQTAVFNGVLQQLTAEWSNLHLLDWAAVARRRGSRWMNSDGYHPNYAGSVARLNFLAQAMVDLSLATRLRIRP